jgi:hypothetical protein
VELSTVANVVVGVALPLQGLSDVNKVDSPRYLINNKTDGVQLERLEP